MVKNPPANAGYARDACLTPGSGRLANHSNILVRKTPWKEEPGRLQFMGSQGLEHDYLTENTQLTQNNVFIVLHMTYNKMYLFKNILINI